MFLSTSSIAAGRHAGSRTVAMPRKWRLGPWCTPSVLVIPITRTIIPTLRPPSKGFPERVSHNLKSRPSGRTRLSVQRCRLALFLRTGLEVTGLFHTIVPHKSSRTQSLPQFRGHCVPFRRKILRTDGSCQRSSCYCVQGSSVVRKTQEEAWMREGLAVRSEFQWHISCIVSSLYP